MNDKDLIAKLKAIKAEVLALKQSYKSGIGRADFPKYSIETGTDWSDTTSTARVTFRFSSGSALPMVEIFTIAVYGISITWTDSNLILEGRAFDLNGAAVILSRKALSMDVEVSNG